MSRGLHRLMQAPFFCARPEGAAGVRLTVHWSSSHLWLRLPRSYALGYLSIESLRAWPHGRSAPRGDADGVRARVVCDISGREMRNSLDWRRRGCAQNAANGRNSAPGGPPGGCLERTTGPAGFRVLGTESSPRSYRDRCTGLRAGRLAALFSCALPCSGNHFIKIEGFPPLLPLGGCRTMQRYFHGGQTSINGDPTVVLSL